MRTAKWIVGALALMGVVSFAGWKLGRARVVVPDGRVVHVVDGDTIDVQRSSGVVRVRLLGVNTPEIEHPDQPVQCFGPEAHSFTTRVLLGRDVALETDAELHDRYGRLLAYVIVGGGRFNDRLLREGYAELLVIPPNGAHAHDMLLEEADARRHRRGLWAACPLAGGSGGP